MSYTEWLKYNSESKKSVIGLRCSQTFAALAGKQHHKQSSKQADIRKLPFSYKTFKSICQKFRVHGSITKTITRTTSPSFSCDKVVMDQAAYGMRLSLRLAKQLLIDEITSVQLPHFKRMAIRYGALCNFVSRKGINVRHPLWLHIRYREVFAAKPEQYRRRSFSSAAYARYLCRTRTSALYTTSQFQNSRRRIQNFCARL